MEDQTTIGGKDFEQTTVGFHDLAQRIKNLRNSQTSKENMMISFIAHFNVVATKLKEQIESNELIREYINTIDVQTIKQQISVIFDNNTAHQQKDSKSY